MPVTVCYTTVSKSTYCRPDFPVGCYVDEDGGRADLCLLTVSSYDDFFHMVMMMMMKKMMIVMVMMRMMIMMMMCMCVCV